VNEIAPSVVINEIHYDPDVKTELVEFVELYNFGSTDVNLAGWYFSDGISYRFEAGAILPAGGYVSWLRIRPIFMPNGAAAGSSYHWL